MPQRSTTTLISAMTTAFVLTSMCFVAVPLAQRSETAGLKETDDFLKAGTAAVSFVVKAKLQAQDTLRSYNALVTQSSKDMKSDYKKLLKAAKNTGKQVDAARDSVERMQATGDAYFTGRAVSIKDIQDAALRAQAEERLTQNQTEYAGVMTSLREAGQSLQLLRGELDNHITYLGSDLTPGAMTSLKPQAQTLNERGAEMLTKADQAVTAANRYFDSLRPTRS